MMNDVLERVKKNRSFFLGMFFILLGLFLFSHNSPFYVFNEDFDVNIDLMAGRLVANGQVPYKDYSSHRGPCSFLYTAICAATGRGYLALFALECLSVGISFYFMRKTSKMLFGEHHDFMIMTLFYAWMFSNSFAFGGKCEEIFVFVPFFALWTMVKYEKERKTHDFMTLFFLNGILSGFIFCVKFTFTGVYVGLCIALFLYGIKDGTIKQSMKQILVFLLGMSLVPLCCVIWAAVNGVLKEMWNAYILLNIFSYDGKGMSDPLILRIFRNFGNYLKPSGRDQWNSLMFLNVLSVLYWMFAVTYQIIKKKKDSKFRLCVMILSVFNLLPILIGNSYSYYQTITLPFGMIATVTFLNEITKKENVRNFITIAVFCIMAMFLLMSDRLIYSVLYQENNAWVFEFAKEMNKDSDKTLLNIYMESPLGNYIKELPGCEDFCFLNAGAEKIKLNQIKYIQEKLTNYILVYRELDEEKRGTLFVDNKYTDPDLFENYELIKTGKTHLYDERACQVELWKRKQ